MIEKFERQHFSGDSASVVQSIQGTLYQLGIPVSPIGPNVWAGSASQVSYGMRLKATVTVLPSQTGFLVDLRVGSDLETNAIIILIVLWIAFFPAALVMALLAYQDVNNRQVQIGRAVWAPLAGRILSSNAYYQQAPPAPNQAPGGQPPSQSP